MKALPLRVLMALCALAGAAETRALAIQDPSTDFAFLEFEPYGSFGGARFSGPALADTADRRAWRLAGQLSFPAGKIGESQFFGSFKSTLFDRDILQDGIILNDGILQRYWLSGGATWPGSGGQSSMALVGLGVNSDFADLGWMDYNTEWIYSHFWTLSPTFNWGLGLDVQQYFHKVQPYPLIFVEWLVTDKTKLKWDADYLELRRFLTPRLGFTAGVRFNLEFFALEDDVEYEYNSMGLETGFQYAVGGNCYLRFKYKELVWGEEIIGAPDRRHRTREVNAGRSLRLNFAYGL